MVPPLSVSHDSRYVCKLKKALYGLKQAPWLEKFVSGSHDSALFIKCTDVGHIILSLYVDDMIIIGDDFDGVSVLKTELAR